MGNIKKHINIYKHIVYDKFIDLIVFSVELIERITLIKIIRKFNGFLLLSKREKLNAIKLYNKLRHKEKIYFYKNVEVYK